MIYEMVYQSGPIARIRSMKDMANKVRTGAIPGLNSEGSMSAINWEMPPEGAHLVIVANQEDDALDAAGGDCSVEFNYRPQGVTL